MAFAFETFDFTGGRKQAQDPKGPGLLGNVADTGLQLAQGVLQGGEMLANTFGADNPVSKTLRTGAEWLASNFSDQLKWEQLTSAQDQRAAALSGSTWEELKAAARTFGRDPVGFLVNAAGTSIPTIAAAFLPGGQGAALGRLAALGMGAAQGAGAVKGQIYSEVEQAWKQAGATDEEAESRAAAAQAYLSSNAGQIALGTALGAVAGGTGVEAGILARQGGIVGKAAADAAATAPTSLMARAAARIPRFAKEGVKEALPEAAQGGQEQLAGNVALQNEGFDRDTMQGVAGNALLEGLAGGAFGAATSPLTRAPQAQQQRADQALSDLANAKTADEMIGAATRAVDVPIVPGGIDARAEDRALSAMEQMAQQDANAIRFGNTPDPRTNPLAGMARQSQQVDSVRPGDLLTGDSMPYGSLSAATLRARRDGGSVVAVDGGWVVRPAAQDLDVNASTTKADANGGGVTYTDQKGNVLDAHAIQNHGLDLLDIPSQRVVLGRMLRSLEDAEIVRRVVERIPVNVMDVLFGAQGPTKDALHDGSVLQDALAVQLDDSVAANINPTADAIVRAVAGVAAELGPSHANALTASLKHAAAVDARKTANRGEVLTTTRLGAEQVSSPRAVDLAGEAKNGLRAARTLDDRQVSTPISIDALGPSTVAPVDGPPTVRPSSASGNVSDVVYGTKSGATIRARREGLGTDSVIEVPGGYAVRTQEATSVQPELPSASAGVSGAGADGAGAADAGGGAVRPVAADARGAQPVGADAAGQGGGSDLPAGDRRGTADALTPVRTRFGGTVYVRQQDLEGGRDRMRYFTSTGKSRGVIVRDNLDPDGSKQASENQANTDNPLFDTITAKNGAAFATEAAASRERSMRGLGDGYSIEPVRGGFVLRRKKQEAATPPAPIEGAQPQGERNGQEGRMRQQAEEEVAGRSAQDQAAPAAEGPGTTLATPAPATTLAERVEAKRAPTREAVDDRQTPREVVELRKRLVILNKLKDCLNG